ncbi:MAG: FecR domain-containing protein [Deltaproteobacteria bacterium]|nr:FecR domain-containing protein [Deltaproteobacteria bacterium]
MKNKRSGKNRIQITTLLLSIAILFLSPFYLEASERQSIKVKVNDSISFLCFKVYGRFSPEMTKHFFKINPHIKDWDNLPKGEEIIFLSKKEMNSIVPEQKRETVVITFLKHPVIIEKDTKSPHKKALVNMILDSKDRIEVKPGGSVELMMSHGRVIRLDEGSILRIGALKRDEHKKSVVGKFKLFLGRLWGKVLQAKSRRKKEMYVSTPTLVAGVRGTAYDLKLKRDQSTIIKVFEGEVEIYNPLQKMPESGIITDFKKPHRVQGPHRITEKEWNKILLRQYQQVIVTKEGISTPISFDHETERKIEWIRWNEKRDLRLSETEIL